MGMKKITSFIANSIFSSGCVVTIVPENCILVLTHACIQNTASYDPSTPKQRVDVSFKKDNKVLPLCCLFTGEQEHTMLNMYFLANEHVIFSCTKKNVVLSGVVLKK